MSGASVPENKIEKKLRNAKEILFKMLLFYLADGTLPVQLLGFGSQNRHAQHAGLYDTGLPRLLYSLKVSKRRPISSRTAKAVVENRERLQLSERDSLRILKLLDAPSSPNAKLRAAAKALPDSRT